MSYIKALIVSAVVALAIIFMIQNIEALNHPLAIRLNLLFMNFESTPYATYLIIMLAFFVGLLAASLLGLSERFRLRRLLRSKAREISNLEKEINSLRNLPLTDETLSNSEAALPAPVEGENAQKEA